MNEKNERGKIDWMITLLPLGIVIALCVLFFFVPEQSNAVLSQIRFFFGDTFLFYALRRRAFLCLKSDFFIIFSS